MVTRPNDLTLIDLPKYALLLVDVFSVQFLMLPTLSIPILVRVEIESGLCLDASKVHPRIILYMPVSIDVISSFQCTDISIPWLLFSIPPVFAQSLGLWNWSNGRSVD